ncbi:MAG TPA: BMP family ABC transporter substrate-binding protein [Miltoncostaeaceae bacterium]|nr:BMP family ABC transporter substrate-binding protein [Miltoncostaeaceae bacterium]
MRRSRLAIGALVALGLTAGAPAVGTAAPEPPSVVLVTHDCAMREFICPPFAQAARRTGTRARIVSLDPREDVAGTFALLAQQGHDLVIGDPEMSPELAAVAERNPQTRFATIDIPLRDAVPRPPNVAVVEIRPREAAYLAGWLAGRMERLRPGPDVVGAVGGFPVPPVDDFIVAFRAGARRAAPGVRVLTDYARSFTDPTACAVVAERQIARGAGVLLDVAGGCGPGTLDAARSAGVWAVGVDRDRAGLGPHILTSVLKRYDRAFAMLMRQARTDRAPAGRGIVMGLRGGGTELGRISPRVPGRVMRELAGVRRAILRGTIGVPGAG